MLKISIISFMHMLCIGCALASHTNLRKSIKSTPTAPVWISMLMGSSERNHDPTADPTVTIDGHSKLEGKGNDSIRQSTPCPILLPPADTKLTFTQPQVQVQPVRSETGEVKTASIEVQSDSAKIQVKDDGTQPPIGITVKDRREIETQIVTPQLDIVTVTTGIFDDTKKTEKPTADDKQEKPSSSPKVEGELTHETVRAQRFTWLRPKSAVVQRTDRSHRDHRKPPVATHQYITSYPKSIEDQLTRHDLVGSDDEGRSPTPPSLLDSEIERRIQENNRNYAERSRQKYRKRQEEELKRLQEAKRQKEQEERRYKEQEERKLQEQQRLQEAKKRYEEKKRQDEKRRHEERKRQDEKRRHEEKRPQRRRSARPGLSTIQQMAAYCRGGGDGSDDDEMCNVLAVAFVNAIDNDDIRVSKSLQKRLANPLSGVMKIQ